MRKILGLSIIFFICAALFAEDGALEISSQASKNSAGSRWQKSSEISGQAERAKPASADSPTADLPKSQGSRWQVTSKPAAKSSKEASVPTHTPKSQGSRWQKSSTLQPAKKTTANSDEFTVYVFKIEGAITSPQVEFADRVVRLASDAKADAVVVDMNTPGGDLDSTIKIMNALSSFDGLTVCYVNTDAISAGSFIAIACDKIFFAPKGVMGAAEAVNASGGDIEDSMKRKIKSFLGAKVRAIEPSGNPRRAQVQRAMNDPDFELKIGGKIIKPKGELLTLTAAEAAQIIDGEAIISDGTADNIDAVVAKIAKSKTPRVVDIQKTWADSSAMFISSIAPMLLGVAIFLVVMDLKGGGLGVLSAIGFGVAILVFLGVNMSGLAGYEGILIFIAGVLLVLAEIFFFQGTFVSMFLGVCIMIVASAWILGGVWPEREWQYNLSAIYDGIVRFGISICVAFACVLVLGRFFKHIPFFGRLVLNPCADGNAQSRGAAQLAGNQKKSPRIGDIGTCITDLNPSGKAYFNGAVIEVRSDFGMLQRGEKVVISSKNDFNFTVKKYSQNK